ncbi:hypothetical protein RIVM261_041190 [Rivularia sp. IAM M-261]|nr:hypothetical protein RIVM261_041190 [Rivularia sp. IAM M-261]
MPYELVQQSPGSVNVTKNLESFWILYQFNVNKATKKIEIIRGYFAAYISQKSGNPLIESLYKQQSKEKNDAYRKFEISNIASQKIGINNARLVDSRFAQFSNEVSQIHLFDLSDENEHKKEWIDTKGWTPKFSNPSKNDDGKYFLKQTINFGQVKDRYVYWLATQANENGTERFAVATPFIANSLMGTILALHQQDLPKIQISVDEKPWSYPSGEEIPGDIQGYLMVAEGAFKSITLSGEIDTLIKKVTSKQPSKDILTYLSEIIHKYPTPIHRTINTAPVTSSSALIPSNPELPIEILYMEGLNSSPDKPVDLIIK